MPKRNGRNSGHKFTVQLLETVRLCGATACTNPHWHSLSLLLLWMCAQKSFTVERRSLPLTPPTPRWGERFWRERSLDDRGEVVLNASLRLLKLQHGQSFDQMTNTVQIRGEMRFRNAKTLTADWLRDIFLVVYPQPHLNEDVLYKNTAKFTANPALCKLYEYILYHLQNNKNEFDVFWLNWTTLKLLLKNHRCHWKIICPGNLANCSKNLFLIFFSLCLVKSVSLYSPWFLYICLTVCLFFSHLSPLPEMQWVGQLSQSLGLNWTKTQRAVILQITVNIHWQKYDPPFTVLSFHILPHPLIRQFPAVCLMVASISIIIAWGVAGLFD